MTSRPANDPDIPLEMLETLEETPAGRDRTRVGFLGVRAELHHGCAPRPPHDAIGSLHGSALRGSENRAFT